MLFSVSGVEPLPLAGESALLSPNDWHDWADT